MVRYVIRPPEWGTPCTISTWAVANEPVQSILTQHAMSGWFPAVYGGYIKQCHSVDDGGFAELDE